MFITLVPKSKNMEHIDHDELKAVISNDAFDKYTSEQLFSDTKYYFESMKSAPFFGEETLGIYVDIYKKLGEKGYSPALYELGLLYYNGEFWLPSDYALSLDYHQKAAALGNADAMFELYVYYATGIGTEIDSETATDWNLKAANAGSDRACYNMGTFYATGNNMPQDMEKAVNWYDKASQLGNVRATETLGLMYRYGEGVPQDEAKVDTYEKLENEQREAFLRRMDEM